MRGPIVRLSPGLFLALLPAAATPSVVVPPAVAVDIADFAFGPAEIAVAPGTTIVWTNRDDIPHDVVAADAPRAFRSAPLDTDERFAFRFDREGRFPYYCSLHSRMQGVVVVR